MQKHGCLSREDRKRPVGTEQYSAIVGRAGVVQEAAGLVSLAEVMSRR